MRHSAVVRIDLAVGGRTFDVAALGPGYVKLRDASDLPPGRGQITMTVDGEVKDWEVDLVDGIRVGVEKTRIVAVLPSAATA